MSGRRVEKSDGESNRSGAAEPDGPARFVVWTIWAGMLGSVLALIARYARNVPFYDDWTLVPVLSGQQRVDLAWLWASHNGHRMLIPKLALLGLHRLTGWDFRSGMVASALLLGVAAVALIRVARARRGFTSYSDAVFPLLLLSWAHYENLLWGWQLSLVLPTTVATILFAAVVRWGLAPPLPVRLLGALAVVCLPLTDAVGLACTPGFALWMFLVGIEGRRGHGWSARRLVIPWGAGAVALALAGLYFVNLNNTWTPPFNLIGIIRRTLLLVAHGYGPAADATYPVSIALAFGLLSTAVVLVARSLRDPTRRNDGLALLAALVAFAGLAVSIGVSRFGKVPRLFLFGVPTLCWIYLAVEYLPTGAARSAARAVLALLAAGAAAFSVPIGLAHARERGRTMRAFVREMEAGAPPSRLIARYQRNLVEYPGTGAGYAHEQLNRRFEQLRRAGVGPFRALAPEGPLRSIPLDRLAPVRVERSGRIAWVWRRDTALYVIGVRIRRPDGAADGGRPRQPWTLWWKPRYAMQLSARRSYVHWWRPTESGTTVWIHDRVSVFRLEAPTEQESAEVPALFALVSDTAGSAGRR
jgi:hypothetical protein